MRGLYSTITGPDSCMEIARKILFAALGVLLFLIALAVFLPSAAEVQRAVLIDARTATVFALSSDIEQVRKWSTWTNVDPNALFETVGPRRGQGAGISWQSTVVGAGSLTIVESVPLQRVVSRLKLRSTRPALATLVVQQADDGTRVTWTVQKTFGMNLAARYVGLMLERNLGDDIESGLQNLKSMAESLPRADFHDLRIDEISLQAVDIAMLRTSSVPQSNAISEATSSAYFDILRFIDTYGLREAGAPMIISRGYSGSKVLFDAAIPVRGTATTEPPASERVHLGVSYAGPVIRVQHSGSYAHLPQTHDKIAAYLAALGIERNGDSWESYVSDPARTAESELLTYIYYPVRQ
jgi:effector-binding domain-containing protein